MWLNRLPGIPFQRRTTPSVKNFFSNIQSKLPGAAWGCVLLSFSGHLGEEAPGYSHLSVAVESDKEGQLYATTEMTKLHFSFLSSTQPLRKISYQQTNMKTTW